MIRSGTLEFSQYTIRPAKITPKLITTSFEVKMRLAFICASSLFLDLWSRCKQIPFPINAKIEIIIIVR